MQKIKSLIQDAIENLYQVHSDPEITRAPKPELGDYCINVFPLTKTLGKAPNIIAGEVAIKLAENTTIFKGSSATGGYVNFFLTNVMWGEIFDTHSLGEHNKKNETIVVDYIGANVGKPLHIGHICTPSIGQTISNVYRYLGYNVIGDSHFGDWGGIFGKLITQAKLLDYIERTNPTGRENLIVLNDEEKIIYQKIASSIGEWQDSLKGEEKEKILSVSHELTKLYENGGDYIMILYYTYILVTSFAEHNQDVNSQCLIEFKKLAQGNMINIKLWQDFTNVSITQTKEKLQLLNIESTYNIGESFYEGLWLPRPNHEDYPDLEYTMKEIVKELIEKGVAIQNEDGSVGVVFPEENKMPSCILQKKDGTGLYLTSDLAAIKYRLTNGWNPSKIIYSVDVRQQLHLKQAFWIAKQAWPELTAGVEFYHASNGFIKLKEGAMSTRHGTVIFLQALIDEGNERTSKILEEKGRVGEKALDSNDIQAITIGAIKYSYLAQDREKDVVFDWDKALSFEGNSGPYIQYAYVRASKIVADITISLVSDIGALDLSRYDTSLIQKLADFEGVVATVAKTYKPHHLALYAYDLAVTFNSFYVHTPKILEETDTDIKNFRLLLVSKTAKTLEKAFDLLAIKMPSEM